MFRCVLNFYVWVPFSQMATVFLTSCLLLWAVKHLKKKSLSFIKENICSPKSNFLPLRDAHIKNGGK